MRCNEMQCDAMRWMSRVDATNWGETQKIIEAIHKMPLDGVTSRRDADEVHNLRSLTNVINAVSMPAPNGKASGSGRLHVGFSDTHVVCFRPC